MSITLYNSTSYKISRLITKRYSTSFSLGIRMLHKKYHNPIYAIYGFVRCADEIVDSFPDSFQEDLLMKFIDDTHQAIQKKVSAHPVLHAFQEIVHQYSIEQDLIKAFFHSMQMDLIQKRHAEQSYSEYIYGSAEVVGLMCLHVFCENNRELYNQLLAPARSLGSAFQKINFLRDMKSDFQERGRTYFPGVEFENFSQTSKQQIEADIQKDLDDSLQGIRSLPSGSRLGVSVAYVYYCSLFRKIKSTSPAVILEERIRVPDSEKLFLLIKTWFRFQLNLI